ncbi:D-alanine--D-alanine ligase [Clarias magur]|uniref:D-alanine--D-alanine ligase n=1 Tax=Clarias magur TaxID=1594786 RepID=A0A8J5C9T4_CLAMG|nr:D-alanine--D-alanine ligase [Clarias magur]
MRETCKAGDRVYVSMSVRQTLGSHKKVGCVFVCMLQLEIMTLCLWALPDSVYLSNIVQEEAHASSAWTHQQLSVPSTAKHVRRCLLEVALAQNNAAAPFCFSYSSTPNQQELCYFMQKVTWAP